MYATFEPLISHPPKQLMISSIEKHDHPELDTSELLGLDEITKHQSLISALQWSVSIGKFDIMTSVMTLSSFQAAPHYSHMCCHSMR